MKKKIELNKRKMQVLENALWFYRYNTRLSEAYDEECNNLSERLCSMHMIAPWWKEAKVRFTSSEASLLESALKFKLMCTENAKAYEELFDLYKHIKEARKVRVKLNLANK